MDEFSNMISSMTKNLPELDPQIVSEYNGYIVDLLNVEKQYSDRFDELDAVVRENTAHYQYSSTGNMHRGFYCPSIFQDQIIRGYKRGKRIKKLGNATSEYIRYSMSSSDQILKAEIFYNHQLYQEEYLIYETNKVYGITKGGLLAFEEYNSAGLLIKYISVLPDRYSGKQRHRVYYAEKYLYDENNIMRTIIWSDGYLDLKLFQEHTYQIIYDDAGRFIGFEIAGYFQKAIQKARKRKKKLINLVDQLNQFLDDRRFQLNMDLDVAISAFEEMSKIKIDSEADDLLFEAGLNNFTGKPLFSFSLTRQYDTPEADNSEYLQLRLSLLFEPNKLISSYSITEWSDGGFDDFFIRVRGSDILAYIQDNELKPIDFNISLDET